MAKDLSLSVSLKANISDLEAKLKQANDSIKTAWKSLSSVDPFERTSAGAKKLVGEFNHASAEAKKLGAELARQKSMADAFSTLKIRPFKDIDADIKGAEQAYQTLKSSGELSMQALAQAKLKLSDRIQELKSQTNGWTESLANAKVGLAAVAASFAVIGSAINQAVAMEALSAKLKYATGSAEGATQALKLTSDMANRLGIDSLAAAQGFSGIAAAARGTVLEGENALRIFESIATASRVVGLSSDQMGGALLAVQQMMSKGVVAAEEFRGQLGERLPGATRIAAEALGVTEAQFTKMLDTGQIVASDFLPKFADAMLQAFGPDAQSAAQSTAAQFAILMNHVRDLAVSLGSVLLPAVNLVAGALGAAAQWVSEFARANPLLTALASVGGVLAASWGTLAAAVLALRVGLTGLLVKVMALPAAFTGATTAAMAFRAALGPLILALTAGWEFGKWLNGFALVRQAGALMIGILMAGIENLRFGWEAFLAVFTGDTLAQATARHLQRLQEIQVITAAMYSDAANQSSQSSASRERDEARVAAAATASAEQQKAAYAGLNAILQQQFSERLAEIQNYYATLQAEVEASSVSMAAKQAAETQLFIADYTERLTAMKDFYAQSEELINLAAETKKAGMKAGSDAEKALDAEILTEKQKLYTQAQQSFAAHVDALNKEYYRHLDAVRDIEQQKLDFMQGVEAALRDIKMQGLSEYEKYNANMRQIDELTSQAKQALVDGDLKKAQQYSNEAIALAKANANAVMDGDRQAITSSQARYTATDKIKKIQQAMLEGYDAAKQKEAEQASQLKQSWEESKSQLESAKTSLDDINAKLSQSYALTISSNASEVQQQINALTQPTSSTHTIYVSKVEQNATGGLVGAGIRRFASGGPVAALVQKFATGGPVFRKPGWSKVPGSGNGDTVPAALNGGSFVVKKSASAYYGDGLMGKIAAGVQKFATGGSVNASSKLTSPEDRNDMSASIAFIAQAIREANRHNRAYSIGSGFKATVMNLDTELRAGGVRQPIQKEDKSKLDALEKYWREFVEEMKWQESVVGPGGISRGGARIFAEGGDVGTDTVPAMLTPGEWVVKKSAVGKYGLGFLDALNNMRIPRSALAGIGAPPVARFADGGLVGGESLPSPSPTVSGDTAQNTYHFHITGFTGSEDDVRRKIVPVLDKLNNRGR